MVKTTSSQDNKEVTENPAAMESLIIFLHYSTNGIGWEYSVGHI